MVFASMSGLARHKVVGKHAFITLPSTTSLNNKTNGVAATDQTHAMPEGRFRRAPAMLAELGPEVLRSVAGRPVLCRRYCPFGRPRSQFPKQWTHFRQSGPLLVLLGDRRVY